ncbi:MAG: type II toxin-antitoxin system HicA family toxin [Clostridiales bacterium]|nr:type II toxin-antitoxin system HicA family toxin [Clostridiales bacterium]
MRPEELKRELRKAGWVIVEGGKHTQATHPDRPGTKIMITRKQGEDIPKGTLNNILKAAGLK